MNNYEILKSTTGLYVEDEEIVREILGMFLRRRFKDLYEAENGLDGLELFKKYNPDIVITDIEMPIMNGLEMIKQIKELDESKPIIIITAFKDEAHNSNLADEIIHKPINNRDLIEKIHNLILKYQKR